MGYLGVLCVKSERQHYTYVERLRDSLDEVCKNVIKIIDGDMNGSIVRAAIKRADLTRYSGIILLKDELFGAFYSLEPLIRKMKKFYDIWGLDYDLTRSRTEHVPVLSDAFIVIEENVVKSNGFSKALETDAWMEYVLYKGQAVRGALIVEAPILDKDDQLDMGLYMPYEVVVKRKSPFLPVKCFFMTDTMLKYSLQHELRRTLDHLEQSGVLTNGIWEYIIAESDVGDLKRILHLEYIIGRAERTVVHHFKKKIAVFAHLFYEDLYDRCISYLGKLSKNIDIYLSTKEERIPLLKAKLDDAKIVTKRIVAAGERGRDAGALLLAFRPYVEMYDYICFIHDKKSSGGCAPASVGMSFMDLVWDNLLSDQDHVEQVIDVFEKNKYLGLLAPPLPIMGIYLSGLLGNEWTICYEETKRLADKLDIHIKICEEKLPFVLSTCFWCRPAALQDLFNYPWKVEDFPEEPMRLDGTINHAIERILPYLAQRKGYCSGLVYQCEYASLYTNALTYVVDTVFSELWKSEFITVDFPIDLYTGLDFMKRLFLFTQSHKKIYVYGAGAQAKRMKRKLDKLGVRVRAFLVTDKKGNEEELGGCQVRPFTDARNEIGGEDGVIIALSNKFSEEVIPKLEGIDYFKIDVE